MKITTTIKIQIIIKIQKIAIVIIIKNSEEKLYKDLKVRIFMEKILDKIFKVLHKIKIINK